MPIVPPLRQTGPSRRPPGDDAVRTCARKSRRHIEGIVVKRELLGVALDPLNLDAGVDGLVPRPPFSSFGTRSSPVTCDPASRWSRSIPGPARHVENRRAGSHSGPSNYASPDVLDVLRKLNVNRRRPRSSARSP